MDPLDTIVSAYIQRITAGDRAAREAALAAPLLANMANNQIIEPSRGSSLQEGSSPGWSRQTYHYTAQ